MRIHAFGSIAKKSRLAPAGKILALALAAGALGGCVRRYDVTLTNGEHLINIRKPTLVQKSGYVWYLDSHGRTNTLPMTRVVQIEPHQESKFKSPQ